MGRSGWIAAIAVVWLLGAGCGKGGPDSEAPDGKPSAPPASLELSCEGGGKLLLQIASGTCNKTEADGKILGQCDGPDGSQASGECADGGVSCTGTAKSGCCATGNAERAPHCVAPPT